MVRGGERRKPVLRVSDGGVLYLGREMGSFEASAAAQEWLSDGTPRPVPSGHVTERIIRDESMTPPMEQTASPMLPAMDATVSLTRSALVGICLTIFACGVATTVAVELFRSRSAGEHDVTRAAPIAPAAAPLASAASRPGTTVAVGSGPALPPASAAAPIAAAPIAAAPTPRPAARPVGADVEAAARPTAPATRKRMASSGGMAPKAKRRVAEDPGSTWVDPFAQ
jgi:hypothetical protein